MEIYESQAECSDYWLSEKGELDYEYEWSRYASLGITSFQDYCNDVVPANQKCLEKAHEVGCSSLDSDSESDSESDSDFLPLDSDITANFCVPPCSCVIDEDDCKYLKLDVMLEDSDISSDTAYSGASMSDYCAENSDEFCIRIQDYWSQYTCYERTDQSSSFGSCTSCGYRGDPEGDSDQKSYNTVNGKSQCITCEEGYEIEVVDVKACTGYCKESGSVPESNTLSGSGCSYPWVDVDITLICSNSEYPPGIDGPTSADSTSKCDETSTGTSSPPSPESNANSATFAIVVFYALIVAALHI